MERPGQAAARGKGAAGDEDEIVFRGSNGLWITLAVLAALAALLTLWIAASGAASAGAGTALRALAIGGAFVALLALGAWFMARQRREVALDAEGVTIRAADGTVRARRAWAEIERIEERPLPSQPLQPAVVLHDRDGTALLIDPQQVRDTGTLYREARLRHTNALRRAGRG